MREEDEKAGGEIGKMRGDEGGGGCEEWMIASLFNSPFVFILYITSIWRPNGRLDPPRIKPTFSQVSPSLSLAISFSTAIERFSVSMSVFSGLFWSV